MKRLIYSLLFFFLLYHLAAQDTINVNGLIKDRYTKQNLPFANIRIRGTYTGTASDIFGKFHLIVPTCNLPIDIEISYMGYVKKNITINKKRDQNKNILLTPKHFELDEVIVKYDNNFVFGNQDYQVFDYALFKNYIVLITFKHRLSKSLLVLADKEGKILDVTSIPRNPIMLYPDCINNLYLICQNYPFQILVNNDSVDIINVPQDQYNRLLKPCVSIYENNIIYKKYDEPLKLSVKYFIKNSTSGTNDLFVEINDFNQKSVFVDDFEYLENSLDISQLESTDKYKAIKQSKISNGNKYYKQDSIMEPIYAPLFLNEDTVIIFDHINSQILYFDIYANLINNTPISYTSKKGWQPLVLKDAKKNKYYTITLKNGKTSMHHINLSTGETESKLVIDYSWIEKINICNDTIYFLYRSQDKKLSKYLYFKTTHDK